MKKLILMLTLTTFAFSVPVAMSRDANWDSLKEAWNSQQKEQLAAQKKATADQGQKAMTAKIHKAGSEAKKTK